MHVLLKSVYCINITSKTIQQCRNFGIKDIFKSGMRKQYDLGTCNVVTVGNVSPIKVVPDIINKPHYAVTGKPLPPPIYPEVKSKEQIQCMWDSCQLARAVLDSVKDNIKVGVTTDTLDEVAHEVCIANGAYPSPLGYQGFPKSICTSINNVACHGIPDDRPLEDGDIINVDVTVYLNGYHGDCSDTFLVGNVDERGRFLVEATRYCLAKGIEACGPGQHFCTVGKEIEKAAKSKGLSVVPAFLGHGIGEYFHGPPDIYHCNNTYPGVMEPGMTFTVEPVLSLGGTFVEILEDGWTAVTEDDSRTAQAEHTVLITSKGVHILTRQQ